MKKKWFSLSTILTSVIGLLLVLLLFSPAVKGWAMQTLMKAGLFQPGLPENNGASAILAPAEQASFKDGEGKVINLSDHKGKVIFINFWATWCPPCIAEMPSVNKLYHQFKDDKNVLFLMVDLDDNYAQSSAFMKKNGYDLPVYTPASEIPAVYFSGSLPTTVILDKNGGLSFHHVGGADYSNPKVAEYIRKLSK